jgi:hypothetical protein
VQDDQRSGQPKIQRQMQRGQIVNLVVPITKITRYLEVLTRLQEFVWMKRPKIRSQK